MTEVTTVGKDCFLGGIRYLCADRKPFKHDKMSDENVKNPMDLNGDGKVTFAEKVQYAADKAGEKIDQAMGQIKEDAKDVAGKVKEAYGKAADKTKEVCAEATEAVKEAVDEVKPLFVKEDKA